jgi:hypothetical protein
LKSDLCPHCGQRLPLRVWLRTQTRTLWTTAELVARYGGSEECIGRELKRLGFQMQRIRQRLPNGGLSKKRALYCVKRESFPQFEKATTPQLRLWLLREIYADASRNAAAAVAKVLSTLSDTSRR